MTTKMTSMFEVRNAILCDDVRREDNGKFIAIGIYTDGIMVFQKAAVVEAQLLVFMRLSSAAAHRLSLEVTAPGFRARAGMDLPETPEEQRSFHTIAPITFFMDRDTQIELRWRLDDQDWSESASWWVQVHPDAIDVEEDAIDLMKSQVDAALANAGFKDLQNTPK